MEQTFLPKLIRTVRTVLETTGSVPCVAFFGKSLALLRFEDAESKRRAFAHASELAKAEKSPFLVFVFEAWTCTRDVGDDLNFSPAKSPDRTEEITFLVYVNGDAPMMGHAPIITNPDGTKTFGDLEWAEGAIYTGGNLL